MIKTDTQLETTIKRITWFQNQLAHLRNTEPKSVDFHASAKGFIMEIDRMQLEVREHLSLHPSEIKEAA